ncbi:MAG: hypothetical protein NVSMB55_09410 [Mycobacteriales bacterium]
MAKHQAGRSRRRDAVPVLDDLDIGAADAHQQTVDKYDALALGRIGSLLDGGGVGRTGDDTESTHAASLP